MERTPEMLLLAYTDILNSIVDTFVARESDNEHIKDKMPLLMKDIKYAKDRRASGESVFGKDSAWVLGQFVNDKVSALTDFLVLISQKDEDE